MIDTQPLIHALKHVTEIQKKVPLNTVLFWELEHARSCIIQSHSMLSKANENGFNLTGIHPLATELADTVRDRKKKQEGK